MKRATIIILGALLILGAVGFLAWNQVNNARAAQQQYSAVEIATV